jgi:hypothetical protein
MQITHTPFDPTQYERKLPPDQEAQFWPWLQKNAQEGKISPGDYRYYQLNKVGYDYDFRQAFATGQQPSINPQDGLYHWDDSGKKPNEPTFSRYSIYAKDDMAKYAGDWDQNNNFIPPNIQNPYVEPEGED